MSVTVKVLYSLTIFLVAFLGHSIAKYSEFNERSDPEWGYRDAEGQYSEFSDDVYQPGERSIDQRDKYYDRQKYVERSRPRREKEFQDEKKHKFDDEQHWNAEEIEVEEGEEAPFEKIITEDNEPDQIKRKQKRSTDIRYKNHRYEDDLQVDESYSVPQRVSKGTRKTTQYEVHEFAEEGSDPAVSESKNSPDVLYHHGVAYVKVPSHAQSFVGEHGDQRLSKDAVGAPPAARYTHTLDQDTSPSGKVHTHSHASGGGHKGHDQHKNEHGHKSDKGHKSVHHNEHGSKGSEGKENHKKSYNEHGGKKSAHHDTAGHYGEHHEAGQGSKGGKFDEKKGHKKGHNTKGYHNKYHRDEYHKEHKFYDDYHKSGSHMRYGDFKAQHASKEGGQHKKAHHDAGHDQKHSGKKGHYEKGHVDEAHKGHKGGKGYEKHHAHHSDYAKKGGSHGGKEYGYKSGH